MHPRACVPQELERELEQRQQLELKHHQEYAQLEQLGKAQLQQLQQLEQVRCARACVPRRACPHSHGRAPWLCGMRMRTRWEAYASLRGAHTSGSPMAEPDSICVRERARPCIASA